MMRNLGARGLRIQGMTSAPHHSRSFSPTRAAGLARLDAFVPSSARTYAAQRNSDLGPGNRDNVSVLSPYVRHRLITEAEVLEAVLGRFSLSSAEKFVQEVFWRTYFKGHLETRPQIWKRYRAEVASLAGAVSQRGGGLAKAYRSAIEGRTGIDCFDAWVDELVTTGYLHNHARMWFASIWIFTLKLPWQLGADFTYRHFIDGDPASNTLSWRWVAGLHTKGKTYLARRDNIVGFTGGRFSPDGLAREAIALDEEPMGNATMLPTLPALPSGRVGLLLTEEDLHPDSVELGNCEIVAVAGAVATEGRSPLPVGDAVSAFASAAMGDALARTGARLGTPAELLPSLSAVCLADFARNHGLDAIVTPYAPVGPVAEEIAIISPVLARSGIRLHQVRRPFDTAAWPHATRGFFALKERIPDLLAGAAIGMPAVSAQGVLF
jgi:deoxyribodipyrimidine photo-lyase